jgi:hypothetical protein
MAYLSSLQEAAPVNTQVTLSSSLQLPQKMYGEDNIRPSYSVTLQNSMDLEYLWAIGVASSYGLSDSENLKSEIDANPGSYSTPKDVGPYNVFISYNAKDKSDIALIAQHLHSLKGRVSTSASHTSLSKSWQFFPNLIFLQDFFIVEQPRKERNAVVHGLQQAKNTHWSNDLTIASSSENAGTLEQLYRFKESAKIHHFLEKNLFLIPLLNEAYATIRTYFPEEQLYLKLVTDPEAVDEEQLVVFIAVENDTEEASQALEKLDEEWWLLAMERAQDKLCITLEFQ